MDTLTQEPLPILTRETRDWCQEAGLSLADTVTDVINAVERGRSCADRTDGASSYDMECFKFVQVINRAVENANKKAISGAQRIQKWAFLPVDFSIPGGELGKSYLFTF